MVNKWSLYGLLFWTLGSDNHTENFTTSDKLLTWIELKFHHTWSVKRWLREVCKYFLNAVYCSCNNGSELWPKIPAGKQSSWNCSLPWCLEGENIPVYQIVLIDNPLDSAKVNIFDVFFYLPIKCVPPMIAPFRTSSWRSSNLSVCIQKTVYTKIEINSFLRKNTVNFSYCLPPAYDHFLHFTEMSS